MDLTASITPKSDQLNAEDFLSGPRTVTITDVTAGTAEQPVNVHVAEFPDRPFKPSKSMRRVMVAAWGPDTSIYPGRRLTLYRDPAVRFGGQDVGGIRVSHMSHIDKRLTLPLTVTRGRRAAYNVDPLPKTAPAQAAPGKVAADQFQALLAALGAAGLDDKDDALATIREITGRDDINNPRADLTPDETQTIIDTLGAVTTGGAA